MKRQALELYLEGLGFRSIGRLLGFSNVTILNWIRAFGEQLDGIKNDEPVQVVEMDEMHSYVGSKKTVEGYNSLFRHFLARLRRKSKCYSKCQKCWNTPSSCLWLNGIIEYLY